MRSVGLAVCNAFSRFGGFLAPYVTVYLVDTQHTRAAVFLLATLCLLAGAAAFALPHETRGRDLQSMHFGQGAALASKGGRQRGPRQTRGEVEGQES